MKNTEYFEGKVLRVLEESETYLKKLSWFKSKECRRNVYYAELQITATNFIIRKQITKEQYLSNKANPEHNSVSIHLSFKLDFCCYHTPGERKETKVIKMKESLDC